MTNQQRKEIIKLHKEGYTYVQLAEKYGVNRSSIREVIKKHEHKRVTVYRKTDA